MRQLEMTEQDKAKMLDIFIDNLIDEYNNHPPVQKKYHSRAEKIGYQFIEDLYNNGFVTDKGIQGE